MRRDARWRPRTFNFEAHYEPRADFTLSPNVRRALDELARRHTRWTAMTGKHAGRPVIHTDLKGIAVGTRLELSRLVFGVHRQAVTMAETFALFVEAAEQGICSGPIHRLALGYPHVDRYPVPRASAQQAFRDVFGGNCCFRVQRWDKLEIGRAVIHQTLLEHLHESGPYHSAHQPRVEAVQGEVQRQAGRYENHRVFVQPVIRAGDIPNVRFCYSGPAPEAMVEVAMHQKTGETLEFVDAAQVDAADDHTYVSLTDYDHGSRRFGELWVMQSNLVRALDRHRVPALYLFMDEHEQLELDRWFTWDELYQRQMRCSRIPRAAQQSPSYLELSLDHLLGADCLVERKHHYALHPEVVNYNHVTFYEFGQYDKRLNAG